jgi:hypothetical protein
MEFRAVIKKSDNIKTPYQTSREEELVNVEVCPV